MRLFRKRWRRTGPVPKLALGLGLMALLLIGCLQLTETGRWRPFTAERPLTPAPVDRTIRVRLGGKSARASARLSITTTFKLSEAVTGTVLAAAHPAVRDATIRPAPGGGIQLGRENIPSDDIIMMPQRDAAVVLDDQTYRGELRIQRSGDELIFVNNLDAESYLRGVLRGELPRYFHQESFKAQAVAARTYVLWEKQKASAARAYEVLDNEGSQMYIGVRGEDNVAVQAVDQTKGQVCVWDDRGTERIFCTYYSSTCGGLSQCVNNVKPNDPAVPPLRGNVACTDCYLAPQYRWGPVKVSKTDLTKRIVARYPTVERLGTITDLRAKAITTDGRIIRIELLGSTGQTETLMGEDFRLAVGGRVLKSTNFEIETKGAEFIFKNGKGFGHGIGLCQWGMETKARQGWDYKRILSAYYPGSKIKTIY
jgi:stage II sporulation protein D